MPSVMSMDSSHQLRDYNIRDSEFALSSTTWSPASASQKSIVFSLVVYAYCAWSSEMFNCLQQKSSMYSKCMTTHQEYAFVFIIYTGYAGIGRRGELQAVLDLLQQCLSRAGGMRVSFYNVFTLSILEMNKSNSTSDLNWQNVRIYSFHLPELCSLVPGIHNAYMERVGIYTMFGPLKTHFLYTIDLCSQWPPLNCAFILLL